MKILGARRLLLHVPIDVQAGKALVNPPDEFIEVLRRIAVDLPEKAPMLRTKCQIDAARNRSTAALAARHLRSCGNPFLQIIVDSRFPGHAFAPPAWHASCILAR